MIEQLHPLIVNCRRRIDIQPSFDKLDLLVRQHAKRVCETLDTRWLVSICDTYADHGDEISSRNAMIISTFANMEKICQSYLLYRVGYKDPFSATGKHYRPKIWDGMDALHLTKEDTSCNLFKRIRKLLHETPHLELIWDTIRSRMRRNNQKAPPHTICEAINAIHGHFWEENKGWVGK